jgi:acetolactate synthase-1/2/3 large subunit
MAAGKTVKMNGGKAIAEMLRLHGASYMFGMGGFQLLPVYDAIGQAGNTTPRHIHVNDERAGAFAADGFARVSGMPGVCDGTLGPGATNLITGLVESLTGGIPIVALTGDSNRDHSGKNMTQETPRQAELLSMVAKDLIRLERGPRIPELVRRAFATATCGKPGPVVLNVPENVSHGVWEFRSEDFFADPAAMRACSRRSRPESKPLKEAAALIRRSNRPVMLAGGGVHISQAYGELSALARNLNIPVAHTLSGKGALACDDPHCLGLFGRFDRIANQLIKDSDLIIAVGFKFGEIATVRYSLIPDGVPIIHIDIVPEEIGRHQRIDIGLVADAKEALADLMHELEGEARTQKSGRAAYAREILEKKHEWIKQKEARLQSSETPINMARVCHELSRVMPKNGILVADGGFAAHWTGLLYSTPTAGRGFVANRGNASIGYGLPGGMGVKLAAGRAPVVAITGDVGFNMTMGELETAIRESIGVVILVVNNAAAGYVKGLQHAIFSGRYQSSDLHEMNYAEIAKVMGCPGIRVEDPRLLGGALKEAVTERSKPTVIDVVVTRDPSRMLPGVDARTAAKMKAGDKLI